MSEHKLVPLEAFKLIPKFDGDVRHLNLFIRKCEYVIDKFKSSEISEEYLMHVVSSRLRGDAAAFISENGDINNWKTFKTTIRQQFDDPRSEASLAMVLENLKIKNNESYSNFYRRIQSLKSILLSKVDQSPDANMKKSKHEFYNHIALQVFLYNMPENVVTIIRMKSPTTLEEALNMVLDEVTFTDQYKIRSKWAPQTGSGFNLGNNHVKPYRPTFGTQSFGTSGTLFGSPASTGSAFSTNAANAALSQQFGTFCLNNAASSAPVQGAQQDSTSKQIDGKPSEDKNQN